MPHCPQDPDVIFADFDHCFAEIALRLGYLVAAERLAAYEEQARSALPMTLPQILIQRGYMNWPQIRSVFHEMSTARASGEAVMSTNELVSCA